MAFPSKLVKIGDQAFYRCGTLRGVEFVKDSCLRSIGYKCFEGTGVINIILPSGVREVGGDAFCDCRNLAKVQLNEGLEALGSCEADQGGIFSCSGVQNITLPSTLREIGPYTFCSCKRLKNIKLPGGLRRIGHHAFAYGSLQNVAFPSSLREMREYAFYGTALYAIQFEAGSELEAVGEYAFGAGKLRREGVSFPSGAHVSELAFSDARGK